MHNILEKVKEAAVFWLLLMSLGIAMILAEGTISYITGPRPEITEYEADCRKLGELRKELSRLKEAGADSSTIKKVVEEIKTIERKHAIPHRI